MNYLLGARAGQMIRVQFKPSHAACFFNVYEPGADMAVHRGEIDGNELSMRLSQPGDQRVQVYQMRNSARKGQTCKYSLTIEITDSGASVGEESFDATGPINCARQQNQPYGPCQFGVLRKGNGSATLHVFFHDGAKRIIEFKDGMAVSADSGAAVTTEKSGDLSTVRVGTDERYEVVDAMLYGG